MDGNFGVCAAFSATDISTEKLVANICENVDFQQTLNYNYVILVAVDIL